MINAESAVKGMRISHPTYGLGTVTRTTKRPVRIWVKWDTTKLTTPQSEDSLYPTPEQLYNLAVDTRTLSDAHQAAYDSGMENADQTAEMFTEAWYDAFNSAYGMVADSLGLDV